jgi:hypothetical protein
MTDLAAIEHHVGIRTILPVDLGDLGLLAD